jgi:Helix-turn-helix domain
MNKAIKYRLYPTTEQAILFIKTFGCCRKVYNLMLNDKLESYKATGKFASVTPAMYKKDYPFLKEVDSLALANVQLNLQAAFRNCFSKTRKRKPDFRNSNRKDTAVKHTRQITKKARLHLWITGILNCLKSAR